jgi:Flp pilus assembly pilin Flp
MRLVALQLVFQLQRTLRLEDGQDLIQYVLLAFLIACGAVAAIGHLAGGIEPAFSNIAQKFTNAVTGASS